MKSILDDSFDARFEHSSPRQSWTWEVYCFSTMLSGEKLKSKTINSFCTENLKKVSSIWFSWEIKSLNMVSIENVNNLMRQHDNNFSRIPSSNGTTFRIKVALHASCWLFVDCRFLLWQCFENICYKIGSALRPTCFDISWPHWSNGLWKQLIVCRERTTHCA